MRNGLPTGERGCPPEGVWDALLADALPGPQARALAAHLDECPTCRAAQCCPELDTPASVRAVTRPARRPFDHEAACGLLRHAALAVGPRGPRLPGPGRRVGGYRLLGQLGRGGMGVVYRARQLSLDREVALKLSAVPAGPAAVARLRAEAVRLARVRHPNIVQVYAVGTRDGIPYFTMELVEGETLAAVIRRGRTPPAAAARLLLAVAGAVQAAHDAGLVHRDLKPSNILLAADGSPKVTDFGLAAARDPGVPRAGAGTAAYMAPEQWSPDWGEVGAEADVYGLGGILYELLTGRPAFPTDQPAAALRPLCLFAPPPPPRAVNRRVPRDLEAICLRCLEKHPSRRYPTARALAEDLRRYLGGRPVIARPLGPAGRAARWCQRHRAGCAAAVLALAGGGAAVAAAEASHARRAQSGLRLLAEGRQACEEGRVDDGLALLDRACNTLPTAERASRRLARATLAAWHDRLCRPLASFDHPNRVTAAARSPDGRLVATGDEQGDVRLWDAGGGLRHVRRAHGAMVIALAFDRSASRLASGGADRTAAVTAVATGRGLTSVSTGGWPVAAVALPDDGRRLVTGTRDPSAPLRVWDAETGAEQAWPPGGGEVTALTACPSDATFAAVTADGACRVWDAHDGRLVRAYPGGGGGPTPVAFAPGGPTLALGRRPPVVHALRSETGRELQWAYDLGTPVGVGYQGGDKVAVLAEADRGHRLRRYDLDEQTWSDTELRQFRGAALVTAAGPADDAFLSVQGGVVRLWQPPPADTRSVSLGEKVSGTVVAVGGDSARLLTVARPRLLPGREPPGPPRAGCEVRVWEAASLRPAGGPVPLPAGEVIKAAAADPASDGFALGSELGTGRVLVGSLRAPSAPLRLLGTHAGGVNQLAYAADGGRLLSVSSDGTGAVWNTTSGSREFVLPHPCPVLAAALTADGRRAATGGQDGMARVWEVPPGDRGPLALPVGSAVRAVAFSPDGGRVAAGGADGRVRVWSVTGRTVAPLAQLPHPPGPVVRLAFSPAGRVLLVGVRDRPGNGVVRWATAGWARLGPALAVADGVGDLALGPASAGLVVVGRPGGTLTLCPAGAGDELFARDE